MKLNKREVSFFLIGLIIGSIVIFLITNQKINNQKSLTKRILNNSLQSMEASKQIADSCAQAYNTATACVSNLNTCNVEEEAKKLDEFNYKRGQAEEIIDWMGDDMEKIIKDVKANR